MEQLSQKVKLKRDHQHHFNKGYNKKKSAKVNMKTNAKLHLKTNVTLHMKVVMSGKKDRDC
jgi:hypothetical protein